MSLLNVVLWALGVALVAVGYLRAREPWSRYQALKTQQENVERYEMWRGGARGRSAERAPSGADVAMAMYLRRAQIGAAVVLFGFLFVFAGFAVR